MSNAAPVDNRPRHSAQPVPSALRAGSGAGSAAAATLSPGGGAGGPPPAVAPRGSETTAASLKNVAAPPRFDMAWLQYAPAESEVNPASVPPPAGRPQRPERPEAAGGPAQSRAAATAAVAAARRATLAPSRQATSGVAVLAKISAIGFMANQEVQPGTTVGAFRERVLSALPDLPQLKGTYTVHVGDENVPASDDSSQLADLVNANDTVYLKKIDGGGDAAPMSRMTSARVNPADVLQATARGGRIPGVAPPPAAVAPPKKKADDMWAALDAEQAAMDDDLQVEPLDDEPATGGGADDFDLSDLDFDVDKLLEDAGVNDVISDLDALTGGDSAFDWNAPDDKPDDQMLPEDALATVPLPPVPTMSEFAAPPPMSLPPPPAGGGALPPPVSANKAPPPMRANNAPPPAHASPPNIRATGPTRSPATGGARGGSSSLALPPAATAAPPPIRSGSNSTLNINNNTTNTNTFSAPPPVALRNVPPPAQFAPPPAAASPPVPRRQPQQQQQPPPQQHHQPPQFRLPPASAAIPMAAVLPPPEPPASSTPPPPEAPPPALCVIDFDACGRPTSLPPDTFEWCCAAYQYTANSHSELGFEAGDWIALTEKDDDGWWRGFSIAALEAGEPSRYFPSSFIDVSSCFVPQ